MDGGGIYRDVASTVDYNDNSCGDPGGSKARDGTRAYLLRLKGAKESSHTAVIEKIPPLEEGAGVDEDRARVAS